MAEKKRGPLGFLSAASFPYRRKSLLSPVELEFYNVLKLAVGDRFLILLKVDVRDLCEITNHEVNQAAFNRVADEKIDFVLCDQATLAPVVAIELDDSTLYPRDRAERDTFMKELFRVIGVSLIHQRVQARYDPAAIARWVDAAARSGRDASPTPRPLRPAS